RRGTEVVFEYTGFEEQVRKADVVITGEGKMDDQTLHGKVVAGVAALAKKYNKPLIGVTGVDALSEGERKKLRLREVFSITEHGHDADPITAAAQILKRMAGDFIATHVLRLHK